ncbi:hypothetical protein SXANM310S_03031 [Streptomyces xanthochromogenes]
MPANRLVITMKRGAPNSAVCGRSFRLRAEEAAGGLRSSTAAAVSGDGSAAPSMLVESRHAAQEVQTELVGGEGRDGATE